MARKVKSKKVKKVRNGYFKQVRSEMKQVVFPKKKEIFKYTCATIIIVAMMIGFFELVNLALSVVKGLF